MGGSSHGLNPPPPAACHAGRPQCGTAGGVGKRLATVAAAPHHRPGTAGRHHRHRRAHPCRTAADELGTAGGGGQPRGRRRADWYQRVPPHDRGWAYPAGRQHRPAGDGLHAVPRPALYAGGLRSGVRSHSRPQYPGHAPLGAGDKLAGAGHASPGAATSAELWLLWHRSVSEPKQRMCPSAARPRP